MPLLINLEVDEPRSYSNLKFKNEKSRSSTIFASATPASPVRRQRVAGVSCGGQEPPPKTVAGALERKHELADPVELTVADDAKGFERIIAMRFADDPEPEEDESLKADRDFLSNFEAVFDR